MAPRRRPIASSGRRAYSVVVSWGGASVLLASQLGLSVEALGNLFDRVLTTGTRVATPAKDSDNEKVGRDDQSSIHGITLKLQASEGVLLFLVREISGARPANYDYPNREPIECLTLTQSSTGINAAIALPIRGSYSRLLPIKWESGKTRWMSFLNACKTYARRGIRPVVQTGGTYLGLFAVRPSNMIHGLDVLVYNFAVIR